MNYVDVPITEIEIDNFRETLYDFYNSIRNSHLNEAREKSDYLQNIVDKCFEDEFKILYCLFSSYLLIRELKYEKAKNNLETLTNKLDTLTDRQKYFYYYFYGVSVYKNDSYKQTLQYFLKAEDIEQKMDKKETALYYSMSNIYARIDYIPKSIAYGEMALKIAQNTSDKAYLLNIESTLAFAYGRIGCYHQALDGLNGCLMREKSLGDARRLQITYHNLGCIYLFMKDYLNAWDNFDKALKFCNIGDWSYLNNKLHMVYVLIKENKDTSAITLINELLSLAQNTPDMLLLIESAKHSLNLHNKDSLDYIENTSIPRLIKYGKHLKAIEYMNLLSTFYGKDIYSNKSNIKSIKYLKSALLLTNKIFKGGENC